jgi:hypothetical protein
MGMGKGGTREDTCAGRTPRHKEGAVDDLLRASAGDGGTLAPAPELGAKVKETGQRQQAHTRGKQRGGRRGR